MLPPVSSPELLTDAPATLGAGGPNQAAQPHDKGGLSPQPHRGGPASQPHRGGLSPERRTGLFYLSLFTPAGAIAVLSGIWLADQGLSATQIGFTNALPLFLLLVMSVFMGRVADRASDWSKTILILCIAAIVFCLGLALTSGFWAITLAWTALVIANTTLMPVLDAATLRLTTRRGSDFGQVRGWGTVGYLVVLVITGYAATWWGSGAFIPLILFFMVLRLGVALQLPRFRADDGKTHLAAGSAVRLRQVMQPWFILPLAGWAAVYATHTIINVFGGLMWNLQGIGIDMVGWLIAVAALAEIAMFFGYKYIAQHVRIRTLILMSAGVTVVRWISMASAPDLPVLFALQALHGITYGMGFLACVNFVGRWTSEEIAAEAQGFFVMLQQGFSVCCMFGFGWLYSQIGHHAWWGAVILASMGTIAVWLSWRLPQPDGKVA